MHWSYVFLALTINMFLLFIHFCVFPCYLNLAMGRVASLLYVIVFRIFALPYAWCDTQSDEVYRMFNTLRPRQNGRLFADDVFKCIFLNEYVWISLKISLKFVPKVPINNIPALVQILAWHRSSDKPLSEPMMVSLLTHICVTQPQWVNSLWPVSLFDMGKLVVFGLDNSLSVRGKYAWVN